MLMVSFGNVADGFNFYGPFDTVEEAAEWAEGVRKNSEPYDVITLNKPD